MIAVNFSDNPLQGRFVGTGKHFACAVAGIGGGKSYSGCVRALMAACGFVGGKQAITVPNLGVIIAPTYGMLRDATLRTFIEIAGDAVVAYNKSEMQVTLSNGSEILFRSADNPERLRGPSISWFMIDEAALCPAVTWDIMIGRLRQFNRLGYGWAVTTPKGRDWVWKKFFQADDQANMFRVRWSTFDNRALTQELLDAWAEQYVGDFAQQELYAEFVAFKGIIYSEFDRDKHIRAVQFTPKDFKDVYAAVDWGYSHPGVIGVGGIDYDGRIWGVDEVYQRRLHIDDWVEHGKELKNKWGIKVFYCDPSRPDYIKAFKNAGLNAVGADNSVDIGIQNVKRRLHKRDDGAPGMVWTPGCVYTASEFEQYQWKETRDGTFEEDPLKINDHCMDVWRYLVNAVDGVKKKYTSGMQNWRG